MDEILADEEINLGKVNVLKLECELVKENTGVTLLVPGAMTTKVDVDDPSLWANFKAEE